MSLWQHSILRETFQICIEKEKISLVCFLLPLEIKMSDTCRLFPLFGDPWPSCLLPSQYYSNCQKNKKPCILSSRSLFHTHQTFMSSRFLSPVYHRFHSGLFILLLPYLSIPFLFPSFPFIFLSLPFYPISLFSPSLLFFCLSKLN